MARVKYDGRGATYTLDGSEPDLVFHYTPASAAMSIISSGNLWATDFGRLNDGEEYVWGVRKLESRLAQYDGSLARQLLYLELREVIHDPLYPSRPAIASFGENGDSARQWEWYSKAPDAYALGFDRRALAQHARWVLRCSFVPVTYLDEDQDAALDAAAAKLIDVFPFFGTSPSGEIETIQATPAQEVASATAPLGLHMENIHHLLGTLKNGQAPQRWQEELEWRLLPMMGDGRQSDPQLNGGRPFVSLDLRDSNGLMPLREVVVGPGPAVEERMAAVVGWLREQGYDPASVLVRPGRSSA